MRKGCALGLCILLFPYFLFLEILDEGIPVRIPINAPEGN
jgi:hypothetical protein